MKQWTNLPAPGHCRRFIRLVVSDTDSYEPAHLALAACRALWPVVQPLSVTLAMTARTVEWPYLELDVTLPAPTWHLREIHVPAHVAVAARVQGSGHREQTTASLTLANLQQLLSAAHAQRLAEGYVPVLYSLELHYTRARLLADETAFVEVSYGPESYAIPVERRADGLWVAGPVRDAMLNPPIKVTLENNDGRLTLTVCAGWSAWVTSGSAETALFDSCLQALVEQGWEE
ncbi:MAG: hypothetical protein R3C14_10730 [Caldilineaceae bacterium]